MASGSSAKTNSSCKGFDFSSDDILCSYEGYTIPENASNIHSEPSIGGNSTKEFQKSRMSNFPVFPTPASSPQEDFMNQDVIFTVEKTMKKYVDNLLHFLEGISSRLSQLELNCYKLDKSVGEMRAESRNSHTELSSKLNTVEKHLQEVHRSVQILRDKQELAETQKELAKLQIMQKESSSQHIEAPSSTSETAPDMNSRQLALTHPNQSAPLQSSLPLRPMETSQQVSPPPPQAQTYYSQPSAQTQSPLVSHPQGQQQYQKPHTSQQQYTQQWSGPASAAAPPPPPLQQISMQNQIRSPPIYHHNHSYSAQPPPNQPFSEPVPSMLHSNEPARLDSLPYGYEGTARFQQPPSPYLHGHYQPMRNPGTAQFMRNSHAGELIEKLVSMGYRGDHVAAIIQKMEEDGATVDFNAVLDRLNGHSSGARSHRAW